MYNLFMMLAGCAFEAALWAWVIKSWFPKYFKK